MVLNSVFGMTALIPRVVQALLMAAFSFGVVIISTIIPTYQLARKKPIDAILGR